MRIYFFILVILMVQFCGVVVGQRPNFKFENLSADEGLSQNTVLAIIQDEMGFMWFGTREGVNRYDAYEFEVFRNIPGDTTSLSNNYVQCLLEDKEGIIWLGTREGLNRFNRNQLIFERYMPRADDSTTISSGDIYSVFEDRKGDIWIGTSLGLDLWVDESKSFIRIGKPEEGSGITTIYEDSDHNLIVGTKGGCTCVLDRSSNKFIRLEDFLGVDRIIEGTCKTIEEDDSNRLWIGTHGRGVFIVNKKDKTINCYQNTDNVGLTSNNISHIVRDIDGNMFVATEVGGLNYYVNDNERFYSFQTDHSDISSIEGNTIQGFYLDNRGNFWVGTWNGGVSYCSRNKTRISHFKSEPSECSLNSNYIYAFAEDSAGNLWIGTEPGGVNYWNRKDQTFTSFIHEDGKNSLCNNIVKNLLVDDDGKLWIATIDGLDVYDPKTNHFHHLIDGANMPDYQYISCLFKDSKGNIWVGRNNLYLFHPEDSTLEECVYPGFSQYLIVTIIEDFRGNLWLGKEGSGLFEYNPTKKVFESHYYSAHYEKGIIPSNSILSLHEDRYQNIWIGTEGGGLVLFDREKECFSAFTTEDGLPNNVIYGILEDNSFNLWLSTNKGICRFNPADSSCFVLSISDGLQSNQFFEYSYFKTSGGEMLFGGAKGFNFFVPEQLNFNSTVPDIVFTEFYISNRPVNVGGENCPLKMDISVLDHITLSYWQRSFGFKYSALNYDSPDNNQYAYLLEGYHDEWQMAGDQRFVNFTNLNPGRYIFRVRASNNHGIWNETGRAVTIVVKHPPWTKWWAYLIYVSILSTTGWFLLSLYRARQKEKNLLNLKELEKRKVEELSQMKFRFFTNVSHELRTPLTLLLGPLEKLIESDKGDPWMKKYFILMFRNANRLLNLLNELLEFRKAEQGQLSLRVYRGDLAEFIQDVVDSFLLLAETRKIKLEYLCNADKIEGWFDFDKMEKVITNLLSNSLKFTPEGGLIRLILSEYKLPDTGSDIRDWAEIKIIDNGVGIREENINKIFERFYQAEPKDIRRGIYDKAGFGIGLSLAKSLVELHHGTIEVSSKEGEGTCFTIHIPVGRSHLTNDQVAPEDMDHVGDINNVKHLQVLFAEDDIVPDSAVDDITVEGKPEILIIEDNRDLLKYLKESLKDRYKVRVAENGRIGHILALEFLPDLIISDIMMPEIDGIELCNMLKQDVRTSHIPIILLTARTTIEQQIEGLETGADSYIPKPFHRRHLEVRISKLIEERKKLRMKFSVDPNADHSGIAITSLDELFLKKAMKIVEENMANSEFSVDDFAREIGMSSSNLNRKIKALTNKTTNQFIRSYRLKRAQQLLLKGKYRINESAYTVGFTDTSYFTKCFYKEFGINPTQYLADNSGQ